MWRSTSVCKLTAAAAVARMLAANKKLASNRHSAVQKQAAVLPPPPKLDNDDDLGLDRLLGITSATVANKVIARTVGAMISIQPPHTLLKGTTYRQYRLLCRTKNIANIAFKHSMISFCRAARVLAAAAAKRMIIS